MGSLRLTFCTGLLACAAGLAPTAAHAADGQGVTVTPASPPAGSVVALRVSGCSGTTGTAASTAFVSDARLGGTGGALTGQAQVRSTIGAGTYTVHVSCAGSAVTGSVSVVPSSAQLPQSLKQDVPGAVPASPVAPVHAGGGGTAPLASAESRPAGPDTAQAVTGLLLAAFAAAAVGLLSVRRGRGSR
ncbi:hypothetical protein [Streptomyces shenzhenensis]|uniref:hypothetical protein n=1 Tax=Streptomyces shenzhenensis TaxID=943815 RepID=UPI001F16438F|nr:hypothetical protein [Streptomyces shenzhenensis]